MKLSQRADEQRMKVEVLGSGFGMCEGPVLSLQLGPIVTSMDHGCIYAVDAGEPRLLARTEGGPNGLAEGADGTLYVAQLGWRPHAKPEPRTPGGIQAIDRNGNVRWVTLDPISPNDICFGPDGLLYFTDPTRRPRHDGRLWRCDVDGQEPELLASVDYYPNGIAFGPEDDALYVASTTGSAILRYSLDGGRLGRFEMFAQIPSGAPDGMAFDVDGRLVVCAPDITGGPGELHMFDRDGRLLDRIRPTNASLYTNVALSVDGTAIVTDAGSGSVLAITSWAGRGLPLHPFRAQSRAA